VDIAGQGFYSLFKPCLPTNRNDYYAMSKLPLLRNIALLLGSTLTFGASAIDMPTIDDPVIKACVERMMPAKTLSQGLTLRSFDDSGLIEESVAKLYWGRDEEGKSRGVIRLSSPPSRKGLAVLMIENDADEPKMYLYVPDLKRSRRVTGKQLATSMMGTDFSYEEFSHFQNTASDAQTKRVEDQTLNDISTYVFETTSTVPDPQYSRILTFVDQERCVPLQTQFFAPNGELNKELIATGDEIKPVGDRHIPHQVTMHDRKKNTRTELTIENVEIDIKLSDAIFSPKRLGMTP
jgi:outer membrane lipoprotein-sorting protein